MFPDANTFMTLIQTDPILYAILPPFFTTFAFYLLYPQFYHTYHFPPFFTTFVSNFPLSFILFLLFFSSLVSYLLLFPILNQIHNINFYIGYLLEYQGSS